MPYISASGEISGGSQTQQPWSVAKVVTIFWAVVNFFYMLIATLINPGSHARGDRYTQDYRGPGGGAAVHHVTGESDLATKLREAGRKLVVIDFFATWCGPCQMIAPVVAEMAAQMSDVVFLKVDVDECDSIGATYGVRAMPTFVFIKNGSKVGSFSGADSGRLREFVNRYR